MGDAMDFRRSWAPAGGLPPEQSFDWVAFDVETANASRGSICSVGVALVRGGAVVASGASLVNPEVEFGWYNTMIHGLDEDSVRDAPTFTELWPYLSAMFDNGYLVAHSASFDTGALRQAVGVAGLTGITASVACTRHVARRVWPDMPSFGLGWVAPALGHAFSHHEAGADAAAAAYVALAACREVGVTTLVDLVEAIDYGFAPLSPSSFVPATVSYGDGHRSAVGEGNADPDHPLFGSTICFTGGMFSMPRHEACERVVEVGANFVNNMSMKVTYLVIGDGDFVSFADGHRTGKLQKALDLKETGKCNVEVVGERDFLALLYS